MSNTPRDSDRFWWIVVAAIVALTSLVVALAIGLNATSDDATSNRETFTIVIGLVSPTVVGLVALLKLRSNAQNMEDYTARNKQEKDTQ